MYDDVAEISGASAESHRLWLMKFLKFASTTLKSKYISFPVGSDLKIILDEYEKVEFPGAIGSMDGTHIRWMRCAYGNYLISFLE